jgi:hypothetical protein
MAAAGYRSGVLEEAMTAGIRDLVSRLGGLVYHVENSSRSPELVNLPDLLILLPGRQLVCFAEIKSQRRSVTPGQRLVLDHLADCTRCEAFVVRPEPIDSDETSYDDFLDWLAGRPLRNDDAAL